MPTNKKNRLHKIRVSEISLVDKGAVSIPGLDRGRNFLVFKRDVSDLGDDSDNSLMFEGLDLMRELQPGDPDFQEWKRGRAITSKWAKDIVDALAPLETPERKPGNRNLVKKEAGDALAFLAKIEVGLEILKSESPEDYAWLENHAEDFDYEETEDAVLIIKRVHHWKNLPSGRITDPVTGFKPGENATHKFSMEDGKWHPKRGRDSWGRYR